MLPRKKWNSTSLFQGSKGFCYKILPEPRTWDAWVWRSVMKGKSGKAGLSLGRSERSSLPWSKETQHHNREVSEAIGEE